MAKSTKDLKGYTLSHKMRKCRQQYRLTAVEQALYHELIAICNEETWPVVFFCSNYKLCDALGITENTLDKARTSLIQAGLIQYKSGKSKRQLSSYSFSIDISTLETTSNFEVKSEVDKTTTTAASVSKNEVDGTGIALTTSISTAGLTSTSTSKIEDCIKTKTETKKNTEESDGTDVPPIPRFKKPTLEELTAFFRLKVLEKKMGWSKEKIAAKAEKFINHYNSNGWKVGKNSMKNWEAAVSNTWLDDTKNFNNGNYQNNIAGVGRSSAGRDLFFDRP